MGNVTTWHTTESGSSSVSGGQAGRSACTAVTGTGDAPAGAAAARSTARASSARTRGHERRPP